MGYQTNPALTQRFTGKERDAETGLDYFGARYLANVEGRWTSPDAPFADQHLEDPQSWNLYSYVRNRPLLFVDLNGRETALFPLFDNGKMVQPAPNGHRIIRDQRTLGQKMMGDAMLGGALAAANFAPQALPYLAPRVLGTSATGCKLSPSCQQAFVEGVEAALGSEGPTVTGNIGRLAATELDTGIRLARKLGQNVSVSEHVGAEFVSAAGKTFDALGTPQAYTFWNPGQFFKSIDKHLLKSNDYTVIDLTGASKSQVSAIRDHVGQLSKELQDKILFVGD